MKDRSPYDYSKVSEDEVDHAIRLLLIQMGRVCAVILVSGRKSWCKTDTEQWLKDNRVAYDYLFMDRQTDDNRKDTIIKQEMYEQHIKGKYDVLFVLDDRQQVVDFWRSVGLKCLQVAKGDF
jgi:hypothetical protein